jgi:hypothetical protein
VSVCAGATRRHRSHGRSKAKKHHAEHAASRHKATSRVRHTASTPPSNVASVADPVCEDATDPVAAGQGSFTCDDGSEPACEDGSEPTLSNNRLICPVEPEADSNSALCEDETAPLRAGNGSYSCDDGSEPLCQDGAIPTVSRSGSTLICKPLTAAEEAAAGAETFESDGSSGDPLSSAT